MGYLSKGRPQDLTHTKRVTAWKSLVKVYSSMWDSCVPLLVGEWCKTSPSQYKLHSIYLTGLTYSTKLEHISEAEKCLFNVCFGAHVCNIIPMAFFWVATQSPGVDKREKKGQKLSLQSPQKRYYWCCQTEGGWNFALEVESKDGVLFCQINSHKEQRRLQMSWWLKSKGDMKMMIMAANMQWLVKYGCLYACLQNHIFIINRSIQYF